MNIGIHLLNLSSRHMKLVLQLDDEAFDDHSLLFQAVYISTMC